MVITSSANSDSSSADKTVRLPEYCQIVDDVFFDDILHSLWIPFVKFQSNVALPFLW